MFTGNHLTASPTLIMIDATHKLKSVELVTTFHYFPHHPTS